MIRVAESREVLGASLGTNYFAHQPPEYAELPAIQRTVVVLVQLVKLPVDDALFHRFGHRIHLQHFTYREKKVKIFIWKENAFLTGSASFGSRRSGQ